MLVTEIKQYVYKNKKIPFVLENLGCHNIKYHPTKEYYSASFKDGDNPNGINIRNNEYLGFRAWFVSSYSDKYIVYGGNRYGFN